MQADNYLGISHSKWYDNPASKIWASFIQIRNVKVKPTIAGHGHILVKHIMFIAG